MEIERERRERREDGCESQCWELEVRGGCPPPHPQSCGFVFYWVISRVQNILREDNI